MITIQPVPHALSRNQRRRLRFFATLTVGLLSAVGLYAIAIASLLVTQGIVAL